MAKFELKFIDCVNSDEYIKTEICDVSEEDLKTENVISIYGYSNQKHFTIWLDKSTAIKFAKTLRTEINKITESEVSNG